MKIGKILLAAALMVSGLTASAQETERVEFNHHWFLQLQGGAQYTLGEADFGKLISPNAQIAVGYQFTPVWALRLAVNGWQSKGGFEDNTNYKWNYVAPGLDVKFNLINAIAGYNPNRVFGLNLIVGAAANIGFGNDEANDIAAAGNYRLRELWDGTSVVPVGRAGIDLDFKVSKRVSINLECMANGTVEKYNSKAGLDENRDEEKANADWYFNALLGLKIGLGKVQNVIPVAVPVVVEEPAPAPVVKETPKPKPQPVIKKEMQTEIFYSIRETVIPEGEQGKVTNLINFLKANPETKVNVTGYADAGTGNPRINMFYSQGRAENVAKALTDAGIDAARITVDYKGDTVQPYTNDNDKNRVSICIAK
ncbi:MAG: OmpA family protein [Bacteroidaceae bacterium]|nr:OmpA family protein [Bacteroidaceae bacterium]